MKVYSAILCVVSSIAIHRMATAADALTTVLICNAKYEREEDSVPSLSEDCEELLRVMGRFQIESGTTDKRILQTNLARAEFMELMEDWRKNTTNTRTPPQALFGIYTGHGIIHRNHYYVVPTKDMVDEADLDGSVPRTYLKGTYVVDKFAKDAKVPSVLIFDSCRTILAGDADMVVRTVHNNLVCYTAPPGSTAKAGTFIKILTDAFRNAGDGQELAELLDIAKTALLNSTSNQQSLEVHGTSTEIVLHKRSQTSALPVEDTRCDIVAAGGSALDTCGDTAIEPEYSLAGFPSSAMKPLKKARSAGFVTSSKVGRGLTEVEKPSPSKVETVKSPGAWLLTEIEKPTLNSIPASNTLVYNLPEIGPVDASVDLSKLSANEIAKVLKNQSTLCSFLTVGSNGKPLETPPALEDWVCEKDLFLTQNTTIRAKNVTIRDGVSIVTNGKWFNLHVYGDLEVQGRAAIVSHKIGLKKNGKVSAAEGRDGKPGENGKSNSFEKVDGGNGTAGSPGANGAGGGGCVIAVFGRGIGSLSIQMDGMQGGDGGDGGKGGQGGDVSRNASGGLGGNGGNSGPGGDGGNGGIVYLFTPNSGESLKISDVTVQGGDGGIAGKPGVGGYGGLGGGKPAAKGLPGDRSLDGKKGRDGRVITFRKSIDSLGNEFVVEVPPFDN